MTHCNEGKIADKPEIKRREELDMDKSIDPDQLAGN
jgi:hypothetical protein